MSGIRDQENIDELRRRLYERGGEVESAKRHTLTPHEVDVSRGWDSITPPKVQVDEKVETALAEIANTPTEVAPQLNLPEEAEVSQDTFVPPVKVKRRYRMFILAASILFFIITATASSIYLFFGSNQISAKNISLSLSVPFSVAAGEVVSVQVSIANQNSVQVDSATLILNYPSGTRSADEGGREMYEERIPIEAIAPGQALNIPVRAVFFGEENETKEIKASIEYRVTGSNGTFFKEAEPQQLQISSSPVVIRMTGVEKISSGQEMLLKLELKSNSPTAQKNILVSATYPNSFAFSKSDPEPTYGRNGWLISELDSGEVYTIELTGIVTGQANESSEIQLKAGNPQSSNPANLASVLSQTTYGYTIEKAFTDVTVEVNGDRDGQAVIAPGEEASVVVSVKNTLEETVYDMRVDIEPRGNLIRDDLLVIDKGFYDSATKRIRFEVSGLPELAEVLPGETRKFTFKVKPDENQTTASFNVSTNIYARRVNEVRAAETLIATAETEVKYSSNIFLGRQLGYSDGPFTDTGPVPPVADTETTYTVTLVAGAGVNDLSGVIVTTSLPQYVEWLDEVAGDGTIEVDSVSKKLTWNVGEVSSLKSKTVKFQVQMKPSVTQVGQTAIILGQQEMRATDKFTSVPLRIQQSTLNNELSTELGFARGNGNIQSRQ
ncbi:MAG: hypothetical protein R3B53_01315 [Candidatus Paceibacterota bacterium]